MIKQFIIDNLLNQKGKINSKKMNERWFEKNNFSEYYNMIMILYPNQKTMIQKIKCLLYGVKYCLECNTELDNERKYCSLKCANQSVIRSQKIKDVWKLDSTRKKQKLTFIKNNKCESNFHKKQVQDKINNHNHWYEIKLSFQEKYRVDHITDIPGVKEKRKISFQEKYGVDHYSQKHLLPIWNKIHSNDYWSKVKNFSEVRDDLKNYLTLSNIYLLVHKMKPDWNFKSNISSPHQRIIDFLNECEINHKINDRQQIKPLELDIYIPEHQLAIEVNGVYWHSDKFNRGQNYHNLKTQLCKEKDINLLHFWDTEINNQFCFVKTKILSYINNYQ